MKKIFLLLSAVTLSLAILAQGNSGSKSKGKTDNATVAKDKGKADKEKADKVKADKAKADKEKKERGDHDTRVWEGTTDKGGAGPKFSKNQPAKVRQAFQRDYPNAMNVYWTKYRGDWTATFGNGPWRSTAVYHANGQRKDTRTPVLAERVPRRILDEILKKRPETKLEEAIKIEVPNAVKDIFRIKDIINGKAEFNYYDADGNKVQYDY
jgi:hypothetical protein